jgi:glycosyltransferase involved in cell wall biosynthesis
MRIVLVTPVAYPAARGNAVTVGRLEAGFRRRGVAADVLDLSGTPAAEISDRLGALAPDVVHAFNAFLAAPAVRPFVRARGVPLVVSLTGTDVNHDLFDPERRAVTLAAVREANAVVVFHDAIRGKVAREAPEAGPRVHVIAQGVALSEESPPPADLLPRRPGETVFLLPAGIRRVKNVLFPLAPLGALAARYPLRFVVAGPVIEASEAGRLERAVAGVDWATYLGEVPHRRVAALLDQADVVVNSSLSEGGMANAVLEAMSRGKPVLASDIEGNRSVIQHEVDGLLYGSSEDFERQAERLIRDPALRQRLGAEARAAIERRHSPDREIDAHLALYRRLLAERSGTGSP